MARGGIQENIANKLIRELMAFGEEAEKALKMELAGTAAQIVFDAKSNANSYGSKFPPEIAQGISSEKESDGFGFSIHQNALPLGAYLEFGTGTFVVVAPEWKDLAWQFYKNGKGMLHAYPYLYPAYQEGRKNLIKNLTQDLEDLTKKFNNLK